MKLSDLGDILRTLNEHEALYLVAGGMAVVAHGYGRLTYDLDLVVDLGADNVRKAFRALESLGYRTRVPITAAEFAEPSTREKWAGEKGMVVLNLWSDRYPGTPVDLFVQEPFRFADVYPAAPEERLDDGTVFRYVDLDTLIAMKLRAGRPRDLEDARNLELLRHEQGLDDTQGE